MLSSTLETLSEDPNPDLDAPTDELLLRVRTIMEASERGELSPEETDEKLRAVVESAVEGQVAVGREIGTAMDEDEPSTIRPRDEDANGDPVGAPAAGGAKRRKDEAGR